MGLSKSAMRSKYAQLDDDEKTKVSTIWMPGQSSQLTTFVTEPGLYKLVLWSRNSKIKGTPAYKFTRWVTHDALPALRKTGTYTISALETENRQLVSENEILEEETTTLKQDKLGLNQTITLRDAQLQSTTKYLTENRLHAYGRKVLTKQGVLTYSNEIFKFLCLATKSLRNKLEWIKNIPYILEGETDYVRMFLLRNAPGYANS
jgi:prophage antirepressor-like protein